MTLVDANVLLYAVNGVDPRHRIASRWLELVLNGTETIGLPWLSMLAFMRLSTSPRVFPAPLAVDDAVGLLRSWLALSPVVVPAPTPRHLDVLHGLISESGTGGNLVSDAHLAALAVEHGAGVASFDRDFLRFRGVRLVVPGG